MTTPDSARPSSYVQLFHSDGETRRFAPGEWRESALPAEMQAAWDDPERLAVLVDLAVEDGLELTALPAAERLTVLRPECAASACRLARLLQRTNAIERAKEVLERHHAVAGESARSLTALARLRTMSGEGSAARQLLRRALTLDPNHKAALSHWRNAYRMPASDAPFGSLGSGDGDTHQQPDSEAIEACLVEAAGEPGAWRPQLELGRLALERGEDAIALDCFRSAIARAGGKADAALTVAYLLADTGRIEDLVELARELVQLEGSEARRNDPVQRIFERLKKGRAIVNDLLERELPLLSHHFEEIESALEPEADPEHDAQGQLVLEFAGPRLTPAGGEGPNDGLRAFSYQGPLWGQLLREALILLPPKRSSSPRVTCFAVSDAASSLDPTERRTESERAAQVAMLPLYLTELLSLTTMARADCTLPYDDQRGLLHRVRRYGFAEMRDACAPEGSDFLVGCHSYRDLGESWLELTLWNVAQEQRVAELRRPVQGNVCQAIQEIGVELKAALKSNARVDVYQRERIPVPVPTRLDADYLSALADLQDLALLEVGIVPTIECPAVERYDRLLQVARQPTAELMHRMMAIAAFAEDAESSESHAGSSAAVFDSVQALLERSDVAGTSLAVLLPALGPRLAAR